MWVIVALACLVLLFILLLCIPLEFNFSARINESPSCNLRLLWFFGLLDKEIKKKAKRTTAQKKKPPAKQKGKINASFIYQVFKTRGLFTQLLLLIERIVKSIVIRKALVHVNLGFENPSDTALLYALSGPINYLFNKPAYDIRLIPVFDGDLYFDAYLNILVRLIPASIMLAVLGFIFSFPVLRMVKMAVEMQWKKV